MRQPRQFNGSRVKGFTLVELMVIVAVIGIIASLAIPGFTTAKKRTNETSAVASLRTMSKAQIQHRNRLGAFGTVSELQTRGFIDSTFADSEKSGYRFADAAAPTQGSWAIDCSPVNPGASGDRYFYIDTTGVIRFRDGAAAGPTDSAVD